MVKGLIHDWCVLITAMIIYTFEMNFSFIYMNIFSTFYLTDHKKQTANCLLDMRFNHLIAGRYTQYIRFYMP